MAVLPLDERFEAALRELTEVHGEAVGYRASSEVAERAFGRAMQIGAAVRRAVRQRRSDRPSEADCLEIEEDVARLAAALGEVAALPAVATLRRSLEAAAHEEAAELALAIFADLDRAVALPHRGYRAVPLRARSRGGESFMSPASLAETLVAHATKGLVAATDDRPSRSTSRRELVVPSPLVLSPTLDGCGSEIALRIDLRALALPALRHAPSGDLWLFAKGPLTPLEIAASAEADDEWWTASPVPYRVYLSRLEQTLAEQGVTLVIEDDRAPE